MPRRYDVGIYVRLSVEDSANSSKRSGGNPFGDESVSIENQKAILSEYAMLRGWSIAGVYADDGYSGGSFNRPSFLRMVEDIRLGKINLVLVKDLSRLGRDYIEVGRYTDAVFPSLGCRFIALMDDIDSEGNDDLLPFRSLLNDYHLRDLSRKIKSVLHAKAAAGEYIGAFEAYGYRKDPANTARLIPDPYAAKVVKRMFALRAQGTGYGKIAATLNGDGILAPRAYFFHRQGRKNPYRTISVWRDCTVKLILNNEVYLGHTVKLKTGTRSYKNKSCVSKHPEDWMRVEGTHEPLVSQELWEAVQEVNLQRRPPAPNKTPERSPFAGLLRCADCGHTLICNTEKHTRKSGRVVCYRSYGCNLYHQTGLTQCSSHRIYELTLLKMIREDVRAQLAHVEADADRWTRSLMERRSLPSLEVARKELERLSGRIGELAALESSLYEDRISGAITPETFLALSTSAGQERSEAQAEHDRLSEALRAAEQAALDVTEWTAAMRRFMALEQPDAQVLRALIQRIDVGKREGKGKQRRQDIRITYRFVGSNN